LTKTSFIDIIPNSMTDESNNEIKKFLENVPKDKLDKVLKNAGADLGEKSEKSSNTESNEAGVDAEKLSNLQDQLKKIKDEFNTALGELQDKKLKIETRLKEIENKEKDGKKLVSNLEIQKVDIEKRRMEELENPDVTEEDYLQFNPGFPKFLENWKDEPERQKEIHKRYIAEGSQEAKLSFKYLQGKIGPRELIHTEPYGYVRENINEEDAKRYADKEADKLKFLFDKINAKYDAELVILEKEKK